MNTNLKSLLLTGPTLLTYNYCSVVNIPVESQNSIESQQIISELKQIVADLQSVAVPNQDTLQKLNQALEAAPLSVIITDRNGRIEYVNPYFTKLTGYPPEEVIGINPRFLSSGLTSPESFEVMWKTITAGKNWSGEFINRKKNGELFTESVWVAPLPDEKGEIIHFVALKEDITRLRKAEESLERSNRTLHFLHNVLLNIGTTSQVTRLLKQIMESAIELLNANQGGAIYLFDEKQNMLLLVEGIGISQPYVGELVEPDNSLPGKIYKSAEAKLIEQYTPWEDGFESNGEKVPGSAVGVPLTINERVIGVLMLYAGPGRQIFTWDDLEIADMFAAQASIAYQRIRSFERLEQELVERKKLERRERELRAFAQTMFDITSVLNESLKVDDVLNNILANIYRILPGDAACLFMVDGAIARSVRSKAGNLELAAFLASWEINYAMDPLFIQLVMVEQPVVFSDKSTFVELLPPELNLLQSIIGTPVLVRDELLGLILVGSETPDFYSREHIQHLQSFANQAALAIHNARMYEEVQNLSITDSLTGVYNRRGFYKYGRLEINRAMRFGRSLSMLFFDIDRFKAFNDRYSYEIGDFVLQNVARVAQATVRNVDLVGRYGGEEFVILIPEVTHEAAAIIAERLRSRVEVLRLNTPRGELGVTISVGVASIVFPKFQTKPLDLNEEDILEKLIQRAGLFLHKAKQSGRNRVSIDLD